MLLCRTIYNTLSDTADPLANVKVDALGFGVQCGEVPSNNYTINVGSPFSNTINITVSVNTGGPTVGLCSFRAVLSTLQLSQITMS
jgi:hypothetical protein